MLSFRLLLAIAILLTGACTEARTDPHPAEGAASPMAAGVPPSATEGPNAVALFAGGCFWCIESAFEHHKGVRSAVSGYSGDTSQQPTYSAVSSGRTGHAEAVRIVYAPQEVGYGELLDVFWRNIDPFQSNGQFCDRGSQYRSEVFFLDESQRDLAEKTRTRVEALFGRKVVTAITPAGIFWPAEEYHQDFHEKNKLRYLTYRKGCGRDRRLAELWGSKAKSLAPGPDGSP